MFINNGDIHIGDNINFGDRARVDQRIDRNPGNLNLDPSQGNLYNRPATRDRLADPATARENFERARPVTTRENNVFADRDGNVARNVGGNWETRNNNSWSQPAQRAQPYQGFDRGGLDQANRARQLGTNRQMARPSNMRMGGRRR